MKKFSKLLAVVLAIAVIICPMMIFAETSTSSGTYKIELVDANTVQLTINSTDGFIAYHATVGFNSNTAFQSSYNADGYVDGLKVNSYTLKTAQANDHNAPAISANASGTSLNVIVMPSDINNLDLCTEIVIRIRVASGATASLTKIQAADDGANVTADPTLLTFPAAGSDGVIDTDADDYDEADAVAAHVHTVVEDAAVAATCTETGLTAGSHCSVCNEVLVAQTVVPALGHSFTNYVSNNDATCTQDGTKTAYCDHECGTTDTIVDEDSALGHTPAAAVVENNVPATCTTAGSYDSVVKCSVCNTELSRETVNVPATGHTPATAVEENRVEATCGVDGHYDSVVYCSVCHAEISRTQQTIPATGAHTYTYTSNGDGTHTVGCANCDYSAQEDCDTAGTDGACSKCEYKAAPAEPVVDSGITFRDYVMTINNCLNIKFRLTKSTVAKYASYEVVAVPTKYTVSGNLYNEYVADEVVLEESGSTTNYYICYYRDMKMHELGLNVNIRVNCYDEQHNLVAVSEPLQVNPRNMLITEYNKGTSTQELKTAIADLLYMCGQLQSQFADAAPTSDLATTYNSEGGSYTTGIDTADLSTTYGALNTVESTVWNPDTNLDSATNRLGLDVVTGKAPNIRYYVYKGTTLDASKLVLTYSYTSNNKSLGDNGYITKTISGSAWSTVGTRLCYNLEDLAYYDGNVTITATLYYDGVEAWTNQYSVETWANTHIEKNDATKNMATRVALFGSSIRTFTGFGS